MADWLANVGYVSKGLNDAQYETDARREAIAASQQTARLRGQQEQLNSMGLEDATRTRATAAKYRSAVSGAGLDTGRAGPYRALADAARGAGDLSTSEQAEAAIQKLEAEGFGQLARDATMGTNPRVAEQKFNQTGTQSRLTPGTLEYGKDPKSGDIFVRGFSAHDNQPYTLNASAYLRLQEKSVNLGPGHKLVSEHSGRTIADNPPEGEWKTTTFRNGENDVPVMYNTKGGPNTVWTAGPGGPHVIPNAHVTYPPTGGPPIITIGDKAFELKPETPGTPGKTNWFSPNEPAKPGQPARLEPIAQPGAGAQRADARPGKFPDGTPAMFVPDTNRPGKWMVDPASLPPEAAQRLAPPAASTGSPASAPAERPDDNLRHEPVPAAPDVALPTLVEGGAGGTEARRVANAGRREERIGKMAERVKAVGKALAPDEAERVVNGFRQLVRQGSYTRASAQIIEDAVGTGKLSQAEQGVAQRMLEQIKPQTAGR